MLHLHANRSDLEMNNFLNVARLFVYKVWVELEACDSNVSQVRKKRKSIHNPQTQKGHQNLCNMVKTLSMKTTENQWGPLLKSIRCQSGQLELWSTYYKSYVTRKEQFMSTKTQENHRLISLKGLLNKVKNTHKGGIFCFSSHKKWLRSRFKSEDPFEIIRVRHTDIPANVMILRAMHSEDHVMLSPFFHKV